MLKATREVLKTARGIFTPVHREGYPFVIACAAAAGLLFFLFSPLGWLGIVATLYCAYFFRDPSRTTPQRDGLIVSPADGRISALERVTPPPEMELGDEKRARISIFMNIFDCHIQRAPISGRVIRIVYREGSFLNAELDKASEENERNALIIGTEGGALLGVVQIAGLIARRIVCFVGEGEDVRLGERFGMIRFGSRVDVYLPAGAAPLVALGQRMIAGETVLADMLSTEPEREVRVI